MDKTVHIGGISGSLRAGSYNTMLLHNIADLLPEGITMEIIAFDEVPLYNADMDKPAVRERPESVWLFRKAISRADAILIVSPEYNYSIPGGLKNAIDWASRGEDSPLLHKPVAVMGATPGMWGTVRMQTAFLPVFTFLDMKPVLKPEVLIASAAKKFDAQGRLTDTKAIGLIKDKLAALIDLTLREKEYAASSLS